MACVYACSVVHEDVFQPKLARVRIDKDEALAYCVPVQCLTCEGTPCVDACPVAAISMHPELHRPAVDAESCVGCGACTEACPYKVIKLHESRGVAYVCDMCGGEPQCARVCIPGAISVTEGVQTDPAVSGRTERDKALEEIGRRKQ
jgi:carbon-monoxide dehydrogenase iron sulfur subunit